MRGVTDDMPAADVQPVISTHTPHARRDAIHTEILTTTHSFQLTRLMRGVTQSLVNLTAEKTISTHTPHARRDLFKNMDILLLPKFQLTRLMRGVTNGGSTQTYNNLNFNSHASCEA